MYREIYSQKKLLSGAAKAAGLEIKYWLDGFTPMVVRKEQSQEVPSSWNPLTNDGDCFRLMVELNLASTVTVCQAARRESTEQKARSVRVAMVTQAAQLAEEKL